MQNDKILVVLMGFEDLEDRYEILDYVTDKNRRCFNEDSEHKIEALYERLDRAHDRIEEALLLYLNKMVEEGERNAEKARASL